jgi:hypothetical protein
MGSNRRKKWLLNWLLLVAIMGGCRWSRPDTESDIKPTWGIPDTVPLTFGHLKALELPREVDLLNWLGGSQLKCLDISDSSIKERLRGLPPTLKVLRARNLRVTQLNLPQELTELDIRFSDLATLIDLPGTVHTLAVGGSSERLRVQLPSKLSTLVVEELGPEALEGYPGSVSNLEIIGSNASRWRGEFPTALSMLRVESKRLEEIPSLPTSITSLILIANPRLKIQSLPTYLRTFKTEGNGAAKIKDLVSLTNLIIVGFELPDDLPSSIESLTFVFRGTASLSQSLTIPDLQKLRKLSILNYRGSVKGIPASVKELDITGTPQVSLDSIPKMLHKLAIGKRPSVDLAQVPQEVEVLDISHVDKLINSSHKLTKLTELLYQGNSGSLPVLREGLQILDLSDSEALVELPQLPSTLTELRIRNTGITSLPVDRLASLKVLDTCGASLGVIRKLPSNLVALRAHVNQLDSEISFPESLIHLAIRTKRDCGADEGLWKRLMEHRTRVREGKPVSEKDICYE